MRQQLAMLHKMLLDTSARSVCRRLMTAPGGGPVVALTYRASIDQPQRFLHSRAVGAHVGLTASAHQSGRSTMTAAFQIWRHHAANNAVRSAQVLLTQSRHWAWLKAWGMKVAQRRGMRRAICLSLAWRVLHRMWTDSTGPFHAAGSVESEPT